MTATIQMHGRPPFAFSGYAAYSALKEEGLIVLKDVARSEMTQVSTSHDTLPTIANRTDESQCLRSITLEVRDRGHSVIFESSPYHTFTYETLNFSVTRPPNWTEFAAQKHTILGFTLYHLGGDSQVTWNMHYDRGLQEEQLGEMIECTAQGGDLYAPLHTHRTSD